MTSSPTTTPKQRGASWAVPGLVRTMRPRQWTKNLLVLAAPVLSGTIARPDVWWGALLALVAFCMAASGVYLVNDVLDVEADRAHPRKRDRPVAAGVVTPTAALALGGVLLVGAPAVGLLATAELALVVAVYEGLMVAYCLTLKNEPGIDIAVLASGFLLRAVAGGAAADIALSQWFLMCAAFGSLFMAAGKRYAEVQMHADGGGGPGVTRTNLGTYSHTYLRFVWTSSATVLMMTYALWAFTMHERTGSLLAAISMAPFVLAVLRYAMAVDAGLASAPEEIALRDRVLQGMAVVWLALLVSATYL